MDNCAKTEFWIQGPAFLQRSEAYWPPRPAVLLPLPISDPVVKAKEVSAMDLATFLPLNHILLFVVQACESGCLDEKLSTFPSEQICEETYVRSRNRIFVCGRVATSYHVRHPQRARGCLQSGKIQADGFRRTSSPQPCWI